ncbi:MAG: alanine/glycine:cation symporter family protein [Bacteroidota bacterium]|nr:alanine/glycine:cation symporter family protein [Bacteroidota bacterium]
MLEIEKLVSDISSYIWGFPLIVLLIGGGLYLITYSRFIPFRYFFHAIDIVRGKYDDSNDKGEISHFAALSTALSATVGMGNIAGVSVAISIGGPGAIFWMWISGIIGMSTKFFTSSLAIMYRGKDSNGNIQGGPMYFITEGLGNKWKPLAIFFSVCGLIGALPVFNVNQLKQAINDILLIPMGYEVTLQSNLLIGLVLVIITSVVILGGLKRISAVASKLVPLMVLVYMISVITIIVINIEELPYYIKLIFYDAFTALNYRGDSVTGGVVGSLIILGIRRGAFSNEAGIGMAPMAHGAAKTNSPIREGLVAMLGPAIDTLFICTLTALAILITGVWKTDLNGVTLTAAAFSNSLPLIGRYLLLICVIVFSVSSLFTYSYYGTKCLSYLLGEKNKKYYNYIYIISIILGATTSLSLMINLIDTFFALMAIPTMLATIILAPKVVEALKKYKI